MSGKHLWDGVVCMGFSECINTILDWTDQNWTGLDCRTWTKHHHHNFTHSNPAQNWGKMFERQGGVHVDFPSTEIPSWTELGCRIQLQAKYHYNFIQSHPAKVLAPPTPPQPVFLTHLLSTWNSIYSMVHHKWTFQVHVQFFCISHK